MEGLSTLNHYLMLGLPSCCRVFGGRAHFSTYFLLLVFVKNMSLLNPSIDPAFTGGGVTPWLTYQGSFKAFTRGVADASLLVQKLYRCLVSE